MASARSRSNSRNIEEKDPKSITVSIPEGDLDKQTSSVSNFGEDESSDNEKVACLKQGMAKDMNDSVGSSDEMPRKSSSGGKATSKTPSGKAREIRLEQNRKAARESRRRKKMMIEELQRSVIFFSKRNAVLKKENEDLTRMLMQAQSQIQSQGGNAAPQASIKQEEQNKGDSQQQITADQRKANNDALAQQNQAMQQMLSQQNLMNQLQQQPQQNQNLQMIKTEDGSGNKNQQQSGASAGASSDLQAAALQAMAAARNMLPNQQILPGFVGMDGSQNNALMQGAFGQQGGAPFGGDPNFQLQQLQQLQQAGQQFAFPMNFGGQNAGVGGPGSQFAFPFPYGGMPQQQMFQFPGAPSGIPNLMQNFGAPQGGQQ